MNRTRKATIFFIVSRDDTMLMKNIWTFELKYYKYFSLYTFRNKWQTTQRNPNGRESERGEEGEENWKETLTHILRINGITGDEQSWMRSGSFRNSELESIFPSLVYIAITDVQDCNLCKRNALICTRQHPHTHIYIPVFILHLCVHVSKANDFLVGKSKLLFHRILIAWIQTYPR